MKAGGRGFDRSIPARAGETRESPAGMASRRVYPRTGGGNLPERPWYRGIQGLSPHGRGKPAGIVCLSLEIRSIPARAGETVGELYKVVEAKVYPRTGGGNAPGGLPLTPAYGLSPHGRGKRRQRYVGGGNYRSIPARAGETPSWLR